MFKKKIALIKEKIKGNFTGEAKGKFKNRYKSKVKRKRLRSGEYLSKSFWWWKLHNRKITDKITCYGKQK